MADLVADLECLKFERLALADQMGFVQTDYYHIQRFNPEQTAPALEYTTKTELLQLQGVFQQILDGQQGHGPHEQEGGSL